MIFEQKIDSIIFDLDGTLWDSTDVCTKAWQSAMEKIQEINQKITKDDIRGIFGLQHNLIAKKLFPYLNEEMQIKVMELCYEEEIVLIKHEGGKVFDNVQDTLRLLKKKYPLFIVSNCQKGYVEAFLEYHNMNEYFIDHECSGNTGKSKSFNIKLIMERNDLKNSIYIGDTQGDSDASAENNVPFIFAKYGFGKVDGYRYSIDNITEITNFFED